MHNLSIERYQGRRGLGSTQSLATAESIAGAGASATVATLVAMGAITGPVGLAISAIVGAGLAIASLFKGCGQSCIAATHIADQAGQIIDQAFNAYMNSPVHYASMQSAYLQLFDGTMQAMQQACSDPSLGEAGQRCISERQPGTCPFNTPGGEWQQDAGGKWIFNPNAGPLCWNSYIGRRNPVANDPTVVPDPSQGQGQPTNVLNTAGGIVHSVVASTGLNPLMLGGLALLAFMIMNSKEKF